MSRAVYGLDPGNKRSALVGLIPGKAPEPYLLDNETLRRFLLQMPRARGQVLVIEQVRSYGMAVGAEVFDTVHWSGRFHECWPGHVELLPRQEVKLHLCGQARAKDANIRQALIDRYGPGKEKAIGRKATPGPLYGFKADLWAALAVAVTWRDLNA